MYDRYILSVCVPYCLDNLLLILAAMSLSFYEVIFFSVVFIILYLDSLRPYTSVFGANLNVVIFSQPARWSA